MLRVPPAPEPWASIAGLHASTHDRMLAHGEIVVAAPHRDVARLLALAMQARAREGADDALELGEYTVAAFVVQTARWPAKNAS